MSKYRDAVRRTANPDLNFEQALGNACLGLAGETGEVIEQVKKYLFHGAPMDGQKVLKELGDVRYYLEYLADTLAISMEDVEAANIAKLEARYPNGFSIQASTERKDVK